MSSWKDWPEDERRLVKTFCIFGAIMFVCVILVSALTHPL